MYSLRSSLVVPVATRAITRVSTIRHFTSSKPLRAVRQGYGGETGDKAPKSLKQGANQNPELYVLALIMTGAAAMVGFFFTRKPTSSSSETTVSMVENSKPWQTEHGGKYEYHAGGDRTKAPMAAPSALHSTVIRNVTLPKNLHDQFNKYGKEEFEDY